MNSIKLKLINLLQNLILKEKLEERREVNRLFLKFGSATPDNIECFRRIDWGKLKDDFSSHGFRIKKKYSVAAVLNAVEGSPAPNKLTEEFPDLMQEDWDAILRVSTLLFSLLECDKKKIN
jgi:hypothetical protein